MARSKVKALIALAIAPFLFLLTGCVPDIVRKEANTTVPQVYAGFTVDSTAANSTNSPLLSTAPDSTNTAMINWHSFYNDTVLTALIDSAMHRNQELNIVLQEIRIAQQEIQTRQGEFLPDVNVTAGAGLDKVGTYSRNGAVEEHLVAGEGTKFPDPLSDFGVGAEVSWEVDIWKKLRNATEAARLRYLSTVEGTNYVVTNLVAEIADNYYELLALDNLLTALTSMIDVQVQALSMVQQQKEAARTNELAVLRFEAEVLKNKSRRYKILQRITEAENRINFLCGRYPQHIERNSTTFLTMDTDSVRKGVPSQLLANRPDVRAAELALKAADLDVDVARARFYPTLKITAGAGYQAFNTSFLFSTPESMIYNMVGDLMLPVINRKAISAAYVTANAKQIQAAYNYERTLLTSYTEAVNQIAKMNNMENAFLLKQQQVAALMESVDVSGKLFTNARADYMEVLLTQRDALEARMELIETKIQQMHARVRLYQTLGGGWR